MSKEDSYIQTWSGKQFKPFNIKEEDICIADIAHGLSLICRYTGQINNFYSVGQHSCYIHDYAPMELKAWGLLHDASEAYLTDINRPTKQYLTEYLALEHNLMSIIAKKYNLAGEMPQTIKNLDMAILNNEKEALFTTQLDWNIPNWKLDELVIEYWPPERAEKEFLDRFSRLY